MRLLTPDLDKTGFASTGLATTSHCRSVEESIERHDATLRDEDHIFTGDRWTLTGCPKTPSLTASCRDLICNAERSEVTLWITT